MTDNNTAPTPRDVALQLDQVLDRLQDCLLRGDLSGLAQSADQIDAAMSCLAGLNDLDLARRLLEKSARNARCLEAAGRGIRAACRRIADVQDAVRGLSTYDVRGRRAMIIADAGNLMRRL